ncbi:hypothetical protein G3T36_02245 [Diaminobutyricibacter tongyongensis]|uniref:Uncharacterized protein n=1 Tax=Leifsonia tongyongensis TaxID=1268043 RepID=A0A6L9XTF5_9MICO|nr:hypothetical protein [Diaminobutyricibacter tongyongensis]NEN04681.1 hypothetical protein [Diaminobutyricibacter tongyongensis]
MNDEDVLLARTQDQVQRFLFKEVATLLNAEADEIEWDEWIASIRTSSEEAWLRCNAFLLAHTVARFLAGRAPADTARRDAWVEAFVTSVAAQDTSAELVLWSAAPANNPMADRLSRTTSTLWALTRALRESRPLEDARPGPFPQAVWISADEAGL